MKQWEHVIGVDPSLTGTAVAVISYQDARLEEVNTFTTAKKDFSRLARVAFIRDSILATVNKYKGLAPIFIEGFGFGCRGRAVFDLAGLGDIIRMGILEITHRSFYDVPPTLLKKYITGKGNANKNVVLEQVYRKFGVGSDTLADDNQVDAYSLAMFGREYLAWKTKCKDDCCKNATECFLKVGKKEKWKRQ